MTTQRCIYCEFSSDFFFPLFFFDSGFASFWRAEKNGKVTLCATLLLHILARHMPFLKTPLYYLYLQSTMASRSLPAELRLSLFSILAWFLDLHLLCLQFAFWQVLQYIKFYFEFWSCPLVDWRWYEPYLLTSQTFFLYWNLLMYTAGCEMYSCSVPCEITCYWQWILVITFNLCGGSFNCFLRNCAPTKLQFHAKLWFVSVLTVLWKYHVGQLLKALL